MKTIFIQYKLLGFNYSIKITMKIKISRIKINGLDIIDHRTTENGIDDIGASFLFGLMMMIIMVFRPNLLN